MMATEEEIRRMKAQLKSVKAILRELAGQTELDHIGDRWKTDTAMMAERQLNIMKRIETDG